MNKTYRVTLAALLFLLTLVLWNVPIFTQGSPGGPGRAQNPPDIAGEWGLENYEDPGQLGASGQPPLGDYLGIPFNDAGRLRSDTTPESIWGTPEYQCRPHSAPHQWRGLGGVRILKEQDPLTREILAYHIQFMLSLDRPIYMDGRPHPPAYAPHSWSGFSTGEWVGNTLKITTSHIKDGYLKRGGPQTSDLLTMTEYITRHDNHLTIVTVTDDPIYMDEPYVQSTNYTADLTGVTGTENCEASALAQNGGTDRHHVPHFLPGQNTGLTEWLKAEDWIPEEPTRGGVKTVYPEYRSTLNGSVKAADLKVPSSRTANPPDKAIAEQSPKDGEVHVLPVQGNIYMLVADGTNVTVSIGQEGIALVNTGSAQMSDKILSTLNQLAKAILATPSPNKCFGVNCPETWGWSSPYMNTIIGSSAPPKPLRYIVNTSTASDHVGGNEKLAGASSGRRVSVIAHENVLNRMSAPAGKQPPTPERAWPTDTYFGEFHKLPAYINGEGVIVYHEPAANTDGDSIVFFRHSEVISAGNIFSTVSYPIIDVEKGGSIQGVIDGLNHILDLAIPEYRSQGGTWVIPGRGRLSDTSDVAYYRNMLVMIRDRVQDLIDKGMTLDQVKAARPSLDFDGRYGSNTGSWTTNMFIEAAYRSLRERPRTK
jgi:glyoxylase-like metal-dependent hydrolase (beta-lactamase superfamily II)